jgi:hypothetical protein
MDKPQPPTFQDLPDPVRREWAALPETRLFLQRLEDLRQGALQDAAQAGLRGILHDAAAAGGMSFIAGILIAEITEDRLVLSEPPKEEKFVDPADRRGRHHGK